MGESEVSWARFEQLRPDQLQELVNRTPVVYWPLGLIEHHGWGLPVGFDGLSAQALCVRCLRRTGGLLLPVMWWGGGGGHERFKWTFYQPMEAARAIFETTMQRLIDFGFRCLVPMPGHGPWQWILDEVLPELSEANPDVLIVGAPGTPGRPPDVEFKGDHAARWETGYGLALFAELIDMSAVGDQRDLSKVWPAGGEPPEEGRHPLVNFDVSSPCFAQAGEDARLAKPEDVEPMIEATVAHIAELVRAQLAGA